MDELGLGHEVLPTVDDCEGFDYKEGCQGHPVAGRTVGETENGKQG